MNHNKSGASVMWFRDTASAAAEKALDGLALRAEAVADNIANAETPNHRPLRVSFEDALAQAIKQEHGAMASTQMAQVTTVKPTTQREPIAPDQPVSIQLETEMVSLARTTSHYDAVARVTAKHYRMLRSAITGGGS